MVLQPARHPRVWLTAALVVEAAVMGWLSRRGEIPVPTLLAGFAIAGLSYVLLLSVVSKIRVRPALWILVAVGLRVPWMLAGLPLSDDAWRYLHDGRAQQAGVNPYRYAPAAPEARAYAGPEYAMVNHPELPTIYPPAAQLLFRAGVVLGGTLLGWKVLVVLADLLIGVVLGRMVPPSPRRGWLMIAYWLHPLPIIEFAGNGHLDAFGILALLAALALLRGPAGSGVAWSVSVGVKYLALPLAPFFVRAAGGRGGARFAAGAVVALGVLYLPFVDYPPVGSLGTFARNFEFNSLLFAAVTLVAQPVVARVVGGLAALAGLVWLWRRQADAEEATFWWIAAILLLSPIVHPWYLTWLLPLALLRRESWALVWSGTVMFAYVVLIDYRATGAWALPAWALLAEYVPVLLVLGLRVRPRRHPESVRPA